MSDTTSLLNSASYLRSNIIPEEETTKQIANILDIIAGVISKSLGPYGSTTIIQTANNEHFMTKDGYTILRNMKFRHDIPKTVLEIVQRISKSLVRTVGDGSTSSIVIANALFKSINNLTKSKEICPHDIIEILNELSKILERKILDKATKITDENFIEEITKIATISNNNDTKTGKLMAEIYSKIGRYGFINLLPGNKLEDTYEIVQGTEVNRGWVNQRMVTEKDEVTTIFNDPLIFMCNDMLDDADMTPISNIIDKVCIKNNRPLVIIAAKYSSSFLAFFDSNLQRMKNLQLVAIDIDYSSGKKAKDRFNDLAVVLDCEPYDKFGHAGEVDITSLKLGNCKEVNITDNHSMFIGGKGLKNTENIEYRIKQLEAEYEKYLKIDDKYDREDELFDIKKRISSLKNSTANLYVGGNSEIERNTRRFLLEDSIFACRSALQFGYVVGGNLIVPQILYNDRDTGVINTELYENEKLKFIPNLKTNVDKIIRLVYNAFEESFATVLSNSFNSEDDINKILGTCLKEAKIYNLKTRNFELQNSTNIINSAETDIEIIKACFSIIGLLATSNQFMMINFVPLYDNQ